jgi:vancomycin resistance protein YoaR
LELRSYHNLVSRLLVALLGALLTFALLLLALVLGHDATFTGKVYRGVSVAGIDLSGKLLAESAALLAQRLDYPSRGRILLRDGERIWLASPAELGFYFDAEGTALAAHSVGRRDDVFTRLVERFAAWYFGKSLSPQYLFDENTAVAYLEKIANEINLPTIEATLSLDGVTVVAAPGQIGRSLDVPLTLRSLSAQLHTLSDGEIPLVVHDLPPAILSSDAEAEQMRQILSAPLTLLVPDAAQGDPGPWPFAPEVTARMLVIERVTDAEGGHYQISLDVESLRPVLEGLVPSLARQRQNARFIFNDDTRLLEVIQPAVVGRALAVDATLQALAQKALAGQHEIPLEMVYTLPDIGNEVTGEQLGIRELVSVHTSYFYGSSAARIQNIQTASATFHGILIPPNATFSMAETMGEVSLDSGYTEALIIFNGRTVKGVGGGVCQVSTTLFRTAFFGGYPIVERHPHAYRVSYYEMRADGNINPDWAGLDATVFVPLVDFKFVNDRPYWLLMETYVSVSARTLTWKLYSTKDGRAVSWDTTGPQNIVPPPDPLYEENPALAAGEIKQVDWEAEGADVTVTRTVTRDGAVLFTDRIITHYQPWQAIYQYGPGTEGMPPDKKDKKK